jgi:hypothetical protein
MEGNEISNFGKDFTSLLRTGFFPSRKGRLSGANGSINICRITVWDGRKNGSVPWCNVGDAISRMSGYQFAVYEIQ